MTAPTHRKQEDGSRAVQVRILPPVSTEAGPFEVPAWTETSRRIVFGSRTPNPAEQPQPAQLASSNSHNAKP